MTKNVTEQKHGKEGHNIAAIQQTIAEAAPKVRTILDKIQALHDDKNKIRSEMKALGIKKSSFDKGVRRLEMDAEQRSELDQSDAIVYDALKVPMGTQFSMFEDEKPQTEKKGKSNAKPNTKEKSIGEQQAEAIQNADAKAAA